MKKVRVYSAFDLPDDVPQSFSEPSMTRQEFIDSGNCNYIVDQFTRTGFLDVGTAPPVFGDCTVVPDFLRAQGIIIAGRKAYDALPDKVKKRLRSPQEFMDFMSDPDNEGEARKLGLLKEIQPSKGDASASSPPEGKPPEGAVA